MVMLIIFKGITIQFKLNGYAEDIQWHNGYAFNGYAFNLDGYAVDCLRHNH
jgi:hypothetical protein